MQLSKPNAKIRSTEERPSSVGRGNVSPRRKPTFKEPARNGNFFPDIAVRAGCRSAIARGSPPYVGFLLRCYSGPISGVVPNVGFDLFGLLQLTSSGIDKNLMFLSNFPEVVFREMLSEYQYLDDPVLAVAKDAGTPFSWEELPHKLSLTLRQRAFLKRAAGFGVSQGYTVPFHFPGEPTGLFSFATSNNAPVDTYMMPFANQVALLAYEKARIIRDDHSTKRRQAIGLTAGELRCILLVAQEKTDFVIARIMGLTEPDVRRVIKSAQAKLDKSGRITMVVRALELGLINYQAIAGL